MKSGRNSAHGRDISRMNEYAFMNFCQHFRNKDGRKTIFVYHWREDGNVSFDLNKQYKEL